jgi:amidase
MRHVHAFGDDALGEMDTVGLVDAIQSGRVGRAEAVEAAIARTEAVNAALNGLAYPTFDQARAAATAPPKSGFLSGVPTFVKDNVDVAGWPTMRGTDAWTLGMMLSADMGAEVRLLELAYELEEARPWARIQDNS